MKISMRPLRTVVFSSIESGACFNIPGNDDILIKLSHDISTGVTVNAVSIITGSVYGVADGANVILYPNAEIHLGRAVGDA